MKTRRLPIGTTLHEAGHAVIAASLGLAQASHEIVIYSRARADTLGYAESCGIFDFSSADRRSVMRDCIVVCFAGHEAEVLAWRAGLCREPTEDSNRSDERNAFDLLKERPPRSCGMIGDDAFHSNLERLRRVAQKEARRLWPQIKVAAELLGAKRRMTHGELMKAVGIELAKPLI